MVRRTAIIYLYCHDNTDVCNSIKPIDSLIMTIWNLDGCERNYIIIRTTEKNSRRDNRQWISGGGDPRKENRGQILFYTINSIFICACVNFESPSIVFDRITTKYRNKYTVVIKETTRNITKITYTMHPTISAILPKALSFVRGEISSRKTGKMCVGQECPHSSFNNNK